MISILALKSEKYQTIPVVPFIFATTDLRAIFLTLVRSHNGSGFPLLGSTLQACGGFFFLRGNSNENKMIFYTIGISNRIEERGVAVHQHGPILRPSLSNLPVIGIGGHMIVDQIEIPLSRLTTKAKNRFGKRIKKTYKRWKEDRKEKNGRVS